MAEPESIVLLQLRNLREALELVAKEQTSLARRFDGIRLAVSGESFLGRVTAAEIEERLASLDARLKALEGENP